MCTTNDHFFQRYIFRSEFYNPLNFAKYINHVLFLTWRIYSSFYNLGLFKMSTQQNWADIYLICIYFPYYKFSTLKKHKSKFKNFKNLKKKYLVKAVTTLNSFVFIHLHSCSSQKSFMSTWGRIIVLITTKIWCLFNKISSIFYTRWAVE